MNKIKLGTKVKCSGYLEKQKIKYVFPNREQFEDSGSYIEHSLILEDEAEEGNIPIDQLVYKFKETEFEGYVIGRRSIPTIYCYDFDEAQVGFGEFNTNYNRVFCEKCVYVDCYIIAYRMNCKRFVPIDKVNFEISTIDVLKRWCELVSKQNKVEPVKVEPIEVVHCTIKYDDIGDDKENERL